MRAYMRKRRERERAVIGEPPVERPPIRGRRPPPPRERKVRWGARAEALKAVAEDMIDDKPRTMMERLAQDYERMAMTAPGYWMAQAGMFRPAVKVYLGGVLRPAIEAYLDGGEMTSTELLALQAYLKRSITVPNCRGEGVAGLRERVEGLDTREKLKEWLGDALDIGIDTL
jgi:hypothetical protein